MAVASRHARRTDQLGLTLMEVLVSMLVMALGLLGIAALQSTTMKYQLGSRERSSVGILLADYAERVHANLTRAPGEVASSKYLLVDAADAKDLQFSWDAQSGSLPDPGKDCASVACNPDELADYDMATWRAQVRKLLPGGVALADGTAANGVVVTFAWRDKDFTAAPQTCTADMTGMRRESCCPEALKLGSGVTGVRCANFTVIP